MLQNFFSSLSFVFQFFPILMITFTKFLGFFSLNHSRYYQGRGKSVLEAMGNVKKYGDGGIDEECEL